MNKYLFEYMSSFLWEHIHRSGIVALSSNSILLFEEPFPGGSDGKESACNAGDPGLIAGSERSPGEGNGNPFQCSSLENSMDRGAWWASVHRVTKIQT